jgi:hypothetical protein
MFNRAWRLVYWLGVDLLFLGALAASWAAFYRPPALIPAAVLGAGAAYWILRRIRAKRCKLTPTERLLVEIAAGRVSDRTRREFDGWVRHDREAAKRRYEEALALVRVDAEDLAREQS